MKDESLAKQKDAVEGLEELKVLLTYCDLYKVTDKVILQKDSPNIYSINK
jgi:hypothetical protein